MKRGLYVQNNSENRRAKEASFVHEEEVNADLLKNAVNETGYTCTDVVSEPYEKKGWFF